MAKPFPQKDWDVMTDKPSVRLKYLTEDCMETGQVSNFHATRQKLIEWLRYEVQPKSVHDILMAKCAAYMLEDEKKPK